MRVRNIIYSIALLLIACSPKNEPSVNGVEGWTGNYCESIVYQGLVPIDGKYLATMAGELNTKNEVDYKQGMILLCDHTVEKVLVGDAAVTADYSPWRLPTRLEAGVLKGLQVDGTGDSRYICIDSETGNYYTFKFGSGSVTKAGAKTKYNIRPIRVIYDNDSLIIRL